MDLAHTCGARYHWGAVVPPVEPPVSKVEKKAAAIERARKNPASLKFSELCQLAELVGFNWTRTSGSHRMYRHPLGGTMNFQADGASAKAYQVSQLIDYIDDHGLA